VGIDDYNIHLEELDVGDLVTFCGYSYTPDFMIYDEARDGSLGVVIEKCTSMTGYSGGSTYRTYTIFWFKAAKKTTEIRDHLRLTCP
jgi:hypothetical protein